MLNDVVISNKTYAKLTASDENVLDEIAVKVVKQDTPDFLLPIKMININGETEVRYEIGDGIRLSYLNEKMLKKEFLILMENMIRPFKICNDWLLDYHKFYLDSDYIVVGKNYADIRYIYRFDDNYVQDEQSILSFFGEYILKINLSDDPEYILNLYRRTKERNTTLTSLLDYIAQENLNVKENTADKKLQKKEKEKKPAVDIIGIKESISNGWENKKAELMNEIKIEEKAKAETSYKASEEFGKDDVKGALINNLFGEEIDEKPKKKEKAGKKIKEQKSNKGFLGGFFGSKKGTVDKTTESAAEKNVRKQDIFPEKVQQVYSSDFRSVNASYEADPTIEDATVIESVEVRESSAEKLVLQLEDDRGFHCPKYIEIDLHKGYATLGRYDKAGNAQADYNFEASLSFISRRHCRIEKKNGQLVIIDLGSGNGTLVNDVALAANMPWPVNRGDRIILSKNNRITYRVC